MSFYNFSLDELKRLYLIRDSLKLALENAYCEREINQTELKERLKFEERMMIYEYQIFILVSSKKWKNRLEEWIKLICPETEKPYNRYRQLYSLYVRVNNMIPFSQLTAAGRIMQAVMTVHGYEIGINIIKKMIVQESDNQIKAQLKEMIADDNKISEWKKDLLKITQGDDLFQYLNSILKLLKRKKMETKEIIKHFYILRRCINYSIETRDNEVFEITIDDFIEHLERDNSE